MDEPHAGEEAKQERGASSRLRLRLRQLEALAQAHRTIADSLSSSAERPPCLFQWGPLQALELVGEGGFGEVYRALDTRLQRQVALKLRRAGPGAPDVTARRFLEEARSLARVRHSNVLVVHGADVHDGRPGFWTDFIRGETLATRLNDEGPLGVEEATRIGVALCRALAAVHSAGLLHGDVKASNVMREEGGRILLMDFGAVSRRPRADVEAREAAVAFGTPLVLAPEVLRGESPGPTSDLYSLGVLLHQLLTGSVPIAAESWEQLLERHDAGTRTPLRDLRPDLPEALAATVERALEPEPRARFQSASELERALLAAVPSVSDPRAEAQTLRSLLAELGRVPEEMCRQIGREAAKALLRAHAAGPGAEDLDLDRILLKADGGVELAREGARVRSRARRGELRALGQVLHELATGEPLSDLAARGASASLDAHASPFFADVVNQLLHPGSDQAIASARDLLQVLTEGEKGAWWRDRVRAIRRATHPPLRRMPIPRATALYGREDELGKLRAAYARAKSGSGQVMLLEGEAGIGKTRLVDELIESLKREGEELNFLFGSYPPGGGATATGAFIDAYRRHLGEEGLAESLEAYLAPALLLVPPFLALLEGESGTPSSSPLTKDSVQTAFVRITQALADERPTVVFIDDLHFAPAEGRSLFAALAVALPGHRVLLIGGARPELPESWTAGIERQEHSTRLKLARLPPEEVVRILTEALTSAPLAEALAPEMALRSDGNPLFLFENLRALEEAQYLRRGPGGSSVAIASLRELATPSTIQHLIQARFARLEEEDKELLDVACCSGFEFDPALVGEAVGLESLPALKRFALIEKRHQLIRAAGRRYAFDHHSVQEALYNGLFSPLREQYHATLARTLESREQALEKDPAELDGWKAVTLCEQFFRGGCGTEALRYLPRSLDQLSTLRPAAVVDLIERALAVSGLVTGRARIELVVRKARHLVLLGRSEEEQSTLQELTELADAHGDLTLRAEARCMQGFFESRTGRVEQARASLEAAAALARAGGGIPEEARIAQGLGSHFLHMGRYEEALPHYARSFELAQQMGNRQLEAQSVGATGMAYHGLRRFDEAQRHIERHLELCRSSGSRSGEAIALGNLGAVFLDAERYDEAVPFCQRHLELARELGIPLAESYATGNLGWLSFVFGRMAEALALLERQRALCREIAYRMPEAECFDRLGATYVALGRRDEARACVERFLVLSREIRNARMEGQALVGLGVIAEQGGEWVEAERLYGEAERAWLATESEIAEVLLRLGSLARRLARPDEARTRLREAIAHARQFHSVKVEVLASIHLALLPGGAAGEALACFAARGARLPHAAKIEARALLWQATGDPLHLETARELLRVLRDHAPEADKEALLARVPLYREVDAGSRSLTH